MTRYSFHPLILGVLGLSIIGLFYRLFTEPAALFQQILFMIIIVAIIFFLFKKFVAHRLSSGAYSNSHYSQPKKTYKTSVKSNVIPHKKKKDTKKFIRPLAKKRNDVNLTVIEGKKNKKKNRALF